MILKLGFQVGEECPFCGEECLELRFIGLKVYMLWCSYCKKNFLQTKGE